MDRGRGQVRIRNSGGIELDMSQEALEKDIVLASQGGAEAASRLLAALASGDRRAQAKAAASLGIGEVASLWDYLMEFACIGTWAGRNLDVLNSKRRQALMPKVKALFLAQPDGSSRGARESALLRGLRNRDARVRRFAAAMLGQWEGETVAGELVPLLADPDTGVRLRAARALGVLGDVKAVPALVEALGHSDDLIAGEAADALALIGEAALPALVDALSNQDSHVRWHAAKSLSQMANPRAADALISALNDDDFGVRWFAAKGLAAMGSRAIVPLLRTLRTKEITPWLADGAIHVFKNIKEPEVIVLVQELEKRLGDSYANVEVPLEADRVLRILEEAYR